MGAIFGVELFHSEGDGRSAYCPFRSTPAVDEDDSWGGGGGRLQKCAPRATAEPSYNICPKETPPLVPAAPTAKTVSTAPRGDDTHSPARRWSGGGGHTRGCAPLVPTEPSGIAWSPWSSGNSCAASASTSNPPSDLNPGVCKETRCCKVCCIALAGLQECMWSTKSGSDCAIGNMTADGSSKSWSLSWSSQGLPSTGE